MYLEGQAGQRGYAMAALLVSVSIMAIIMTALLPVWKQQARREKEAELAFRGEQWARAIYLFTTKNGGQYPPNLDVLVQGRYVRKKYKDPMTTDGEWQPIFLGQQPQQGQPQGGRGTGPGGATGGGRAGAPAGGQTPGGFGVTQGGAGIATIQSKSKEASIRIYNGAGFYNQWQFRYNGRGRGGPGGPQPGGPQRGGPGTPGAPGSGGRGPGVGQPGGRGIGQPGVGLPGGRGLGQGRGRGF